MHVVSVCLHYGKIIWLPRQSPLPNRKIRSRFIICTQSAFIWRKDCEKTVQQIWYIRRNTPVFWPCRTRRSQMSCQLWSYRTEFHEIFTRCTGIICAVNSHTKVAIFHSVSGCQSDESGEFAIICHGNVPWHIGKRSRSIIYTQNTFIRWKDCEIGSADLEIIVLREIIKNMKKERNYGR